VGRGSECNERARPAVPPPTSVRPRSGRIDNSRENVRRRRCRTRRRVACHSGNNATAPRSPRSGWMYRGSHDGSLHSPPFDPRLFPSTAPRSSPTSAKSPRMVQRHDRGATSTKQWTSGTFPAFPGAFPGTVVAFPGTIVLSAKDSRLVLLPGVRGFSLLAGLDRRERDRARLVPPSLPRLPFLPVFTALDEKIR